MRARGLPAGVGQVVVVGDILADVTVLAGGPLEADSDTEAEILMTGGGSAANVAVGLADLGVSTVLVGSVGTDQLGTLQLATLRRRRLRLEVARRRDAPTGAVVALVDSLGGRSMLTSRGASRTLDPAQLVSNLFGPGRHLHLSGYVLLDEASRQCGLAALRRARQAGMTSSVDASSQAPLQRVGAGPFRDWIRGTSVLFANLEEGRVLSGRIATDDVLEGLLEDHQEVVLKLGDGGVAWARGQERLRLPTVPGLVVDTTGAGDAFAAGWLACRIRSELGAAALGAGLRAAAGAVGRIGARQLA